MISILKKFKLTQKVMLVLIIIAVGFVATLVNDRFLSVDNIMQIFQQIAVFGVVSMGMALVIISRGIDLSISGIISLAAFVMCTTVRDANISPITALLIAVGIGALCGLINGLIISYSRCAPLIITLGTQYIFLGIALAIAQGAFMSMQGTLSGFAMASFLGIPMLIYVLLAVVLLTYLLLNWTRFGRRIVAMGGNEENAFLSGIKVRFTKIMVSLCWIVNQISESETFHIFPYFSVVSDLKTSFFHHSQIVMSLWSICETFNRQWLNKIYDYIMRIRTFW